MKAYMRMIGEYVKKNYLLLIILVFLSANYLLTQSDIKSLKEQISGMKNRYRTNVMDVLIDNSSMLSDALERLESIENKLDDLEYNQ
jgi:hypothetical protein